MSLLPKQGYLVGRRVKLELYDRTSRYANCIRDDVGAPGIIIFVTDTGEPILGTEILDYEAVK